MQSEGTPSPAVACSPWPPHPLLPGRLYSLLPHMGWVKQLPRYLPPYRNMLLSHVVGAWESTCHSFCANNKAGREKGPFWEARSVGAGLEAAKLMAILPLR